MASVPAHQRHGSGAAFRTRDESIRGSIERYRHRLTAYRRGVSHRSRRTAVVCIFPAASTVLGNDRIDLAVPDHRGGRPVRHAAVGGRVHHNRQAGSVAHGLSFAVDSGPRSLVLHIPGCALDGDVCCGRPAHGLAVDRHVAARCLRVERTVSILAEDDRDVAGVVAQAEGPGAGVEVDVKHGGVRLIAGPRGAGRRISRRGNRGPRGCFGLLRRNRSEHELVEARHVGGRRRDLHPVRRVHVVIAVRSASGGSTEGGTKSQGSGEGAIGRTHGDSSVGWVFCGPRQQQAGHRIEAGLRPEIRWSSRRGSVVRVDAMMSSGRCAGQGRDARDDRRGVLNDSLAHWDESSTMR